MPIAERDEEHEQVLAMVFKLSPAQSAVLSCLLRSFVASPTELLEYTGSKSYIKVPVSRVRAKLREHGFDIKSKMELGYYIEPEDKTGINEMVTDYLEG